MKYSKIVTIDIKKYLLVIAQENVKAQNSKQDLLKDLITFLTEENWEIKPYAIRSRDSTNYSKWRLA